MLVVILLYACLVPLCFPNGSAMKTWKYCLGSSTSGCCSDLGTIFTISFGFTSVWVNPYLTLATIDLVSDNREDV